MAPLCLAILAIYKGIGRPRLGGTRPIPDDPSIPRWSPHLCGQVGNKEEKSHFSSDIMAFSQNDADVGKQGSSEYSSGALGKMFIRQAAPGSAATHVFSLGQPLKASTTGALQARVHDKNDPPMRPVMHKT